MIGSERITRREFYARGGFSNTHLWRRQEGRGWAYYLRHD